MLKMVRRATVVVIFIFACMFGNYVFAESGTLTHYEPYSEWAKNVGFKYDLILLDKPQRSVLRWEVINLLECISNDVNPKSASEEIAFNDLNEVSENVQKRIISAMQKGLVSGYSDKTFKPFNEVSRGEFVTLLSRYGMLGKSKDFNKNQFEDIENHWSKEYVNEAVASKIISGKSDKMFYPDDTITIEEILIILDRLVDNEKIVTGTLISSVLDTFPSRQYSNDEKYMVEDIYADMEQIQHDMWVYRNSLVEYDFTDISKPLTLGDVLTWRYYYDGGDAERFSVNKTLNDAEKDRYFKSSNRYDIEVNGNRKIGFYFDMSWDEPIDYDRTVTVGEFLYALKRGYNSYSTSTKVNFSNFSTLSEDEQESVKRAVYLGLLPDSNNEFPIDKCMTKALLNYITVKLNKCEKLYKYDIFTYSYYLDEAINKNYHVEMNHNTWPSNYTDYPFIMRPLSNEIYEVPFIGISDPLSKTPAQAYANIRWAYSEASSRGQNYLNKILNVDYANIDENSFIKEINDLKLIPIGSFYVTDYVKYLKENQIKLEGSATSCLPIFYYDGTSQVFRIRMHVMLKVINSSTNKDLLLGDLAFGKGVIYNGGEFEFYVDIPLNYSYRTGMKINDIFSPIYSISLQKVGNITK